MFALKSWEMNKSRVPNSLFVCWSSIGLSYKVLINPSTTDVICTTTAEALAMGKIVICANHPSNEFFKQFPNCHTYNTNNEFVKLTLAALAEDPVPLTDDHRHALSLEAATERFVGAADLNEVTQEKALASPMPFMPISSDDWSRSVEEASAYLHNTVSGIEAARCLWCNSWDFATWWATAQGARLGFFRT